MRRSRSARSRSWSPPRRWPSPSRRCSPWGARRGRPAHACGAVPWWGWLGGACGATYVTSVFVLIPEIGVAPTVALTVAGQQIASVFVDRYGLLRLPRRPISRAPAHRGRPAARRRRPDPARPRAARTGPPSCRRDRARARSAGPRAHRRAPCGRRSRARRAARRRRRRRRASRPGTPGRSADRRWRAASPG